jgi:hypothetical protein
MHKDEFTVVLVAVGIGLLLLVAIPIVLLAGAHVTTVHYSGGCNNIPLVNGQPASPCIITSMP